MIKEYWELVFGPSLYKKYSSKFNWWVRYNPMLLPFMVLYVMLTAVIFTQISNFGLYLIMSPFLYKVFVSIIRRNESGIPIIKPIKKVDVQTPFHGVNVFFFFTNLIPLTNKYGYEKFTKEQLILHKKQQLAKIYFNSFFAITIGIFAFLPRPMFSLTLLMVVMVSP